MNVEPYKVGQLVRVTGYINIGEIGKIGRQSGTTEQCGLEGSEEPIYEIWLLGASNRWAFKHSELEAVEVVTKDERS